MRTISLTELRRHPAKYIKLAETERIDVAKGGVIVFSFLPRRYELGERMKRYFGILPHNASIGSDPNERC